MLTDLAGSLAARGWAADLVNKTVRASPVLEECDEAIPGLVAGRWSLAQGGDLFESSVFEFEIGVGVGLCGLGVGVAEPESDAGGIDPGLQEARRAG